MAPERDAETGRYKASYPAEEFVEALRAADGMASTHELAEAVGSSDRLALQRLAGLEDDGAVNRRKVANANLWLLADDVDADQSKEVSA